MALGTRISSKTPSSKRCGDAGELPERAERAERTAPISERPNTPKINGRIVIPASDKKLPTCLPAGRTFEWAVSSRGLILSRFLRDKVLERRESFLTYPPDWLQSYRGYEGGFRSAVLPACRRRGCARVQFCFRKSKLDGPGLSWPRPEERRETDYIIDSRQAIVKRSVVGR